MSDVAFNLPSPIISFLPPKRVRPFPLHPNWNFTRVLLRCRGTLLHTTPSPTPNTTTGAESRRTGSTKGTSTPDALIHDFFWEHGARKSIWPFFSPQSVDVPSLEFAAPSDMHHSHLRNLQYLCWRSGTMIANPFSNPSLFSPFAEMVE